MTLIMLLYVVMGTSLPCDNAVSSFLTIITPNMNKSYKNALMILVAYEKNIIFIFIF